MKEYTKAYSRYSDYNVLDYSYNPSEPTCNFGLYKDAYELSIELPLLETLFSEKNSPAEYALDIGGQDGGILTILLTLGLVKEGLCLDAYDYSNSLTTPNWCRWRRSIRHNPHNFVEHFGIDTISSYNNLLSRLKTNRLSRDKSILKPDFRTADFHQASDSLASESVDIIGCYLTLPYLNPKQLLSEAKRLLRPGGILVILSDNWFALDNCTHLYAGLPWGHLALKEESFEKGNGRSDNTRFTKTNFYHKTGYNQKYTPTELFKLSADSGYGVLSFKRGLIGGLDNERWLVDPIDAYIWASQNGVLEQIYATQNRNISKLDMLTKYYSLVLQK